MSKHNRFLEPDQIAQWVYRGLAYPAVYRVVVAESYAKRDQYAQIARHIPMPLSAEGRLIILEPGPSNVALFKRALENAGYPLKEARLLGLDPYPRMHPPGLEMLTGSVTAIPLHDGTVDVVVMSSVLYFVTNKAQAIRECVRVLKLGGMLILSEPDIERLPLLSQNIMQYEIEIIRRQNLAGTSRWAGQLRTLLALMRRLVPRAFHLRSAIQINRRIAAQQDAAQGVSAGEMSKHLIAAGISPVGSALMRMCTSYGSARSWPK